MIEDYTENQLKVLLYTFLNTACDEEIATAYDVFISVPVGNREEDETETDTNILDDEDEGYTFHVKYDDDEMIIVRQRLAESIDRDFSGEMTLVPDLVDWVCGLTYIETRVDGDKILYKFEDGIEDFIID